MYNKQDRCIVEAGEFKLYAKDSFIMKLNAVRSDKIVKSYKHRFLIIEHAVIHLDNINSILNSYKEFHCDIYAEHIAHAMYGGDKCIVETLYKDCQLINIIIDNKVKHSGNLKFIFKINGEISMREKNKL